MASVRSAACASRYCFRFGRDLELVQRREVDGSQVGDRCLQPLDLAGQRRLVAEGLQRIGQPGNLGIGLGELQRELLLREHRGLLLEAHLLDLRARGLQLLHGGKTCFIGGAQLGAERLLAVACRRQRLLGPAAHGELALQRLLDGRPVDGRALGGELGQLGLLLDDLRRQRLPASLELGEAVATAALGESRFLRRALGEPDALAPARLRDLAFVACTAGGVALRHRLVQRRLRVGELRPERARPVLLGRLLGGDRGQLLGDLRPPLRGRLRGLPQLQELELEIVAAPLLRREGHAFGMPGIL